MAKFKAGDMITDGHAVLMVNSIYTETNKYSFYRGQEMYSLDNGSGFSDGKSSTSEIDSAFKLCD